MTDLEPRSSGVLPGEPKSSTNTGPVVRARGGVYTFCRRGDRDD